MTTATLPPIGCWRTGTLRPARHRVDRWVVRFGGSLLTRPGWPEELLDLVAGLAGSVTIVAGGGPVVDGLRLIDASRPMPAGVMHVLAIEAMGITGRLVAEATGLAIVPAPYVGIGAAVLDAPRWCAASPQASRLPTGWDVTSDSIAAAVAQELAATLVLAKRVTPPTSDLVDLAAIAWVDAHLPAIADGPAGILWAVPRDEPD